MNNTIYSTDLPGGGRLKLIRLREVTSMTGLSKTLLYQLILRGEFPRQIKLGQRAVAWVFQDVADWIARKVNDSNR